MQKMKSDKGLGTLLLLILVLIFILVFNGNLSSNSENRELPMVAFYVS